MPNDLPPFDRLSSDPALDLIATIVRAVSEPLAQQPRPPALDPADLRTVLLNGGRAAFGRGEAEGENRAAIAAEHAIADLKRFMRENKPE